MDNLTTDSLGLKGRVTLKVFDKDGNLKEELVKDNLIVTAGKNYLAVPHSIGDFAYIGVGSSSTAPAAGNTALGTQVARQIGSQSASTNIWTNATTFAAGVATGTIVEAGLFTASSSGTMLSRVTFSSVVVASGDTLQVTWNVTIG